MIDHVDFESCERMQRIWHIKSNQSHSNCSKHLRMPMIFDLPKLAADDNEQTNQRNARRIKTKRSIDSHYHLLIFHLVVMAKKYKRLYLLEVWKDSITKLESLAEMRQQERSERKLCAHTHAKRMKKCQQSHRCQSRNVISHVACSSNSTF